MRLSSLAAARPAYYDRNATSFFQSYGATVAPHASTVRWTATVAAGTKLLLETSEVSFMTVTVAAPVSRVRSDVQITNGTTIMSTNAIDVIPNNVVNTVNISIISSAVTVYAGETVSGTTFNGNTGGTGFSFTSAKGTTYSA